MSEKKEYIERGALIKRLNSLITTSDLFGMGVQSGFSHAIVEANAIPAADVEPVVRGYWMKEECIVCSHCGMPAAWAKPSLKKQLESDYCASCGANMMERSGSGE